ncbi:MAG: helix-turn-helix domain-containing protein [Gemmatimonadales bacterium]
MLTDVERERLVEQVRHGRGSARDLTHARILLKADEGAGAPGWKDGQIVEGLDVSRATVERVRRRFATEGLAAAVGRRPLPSRGPRKLDGAREAQLIALACSEPPTGRAEWSLRLLAGRMVALYDDLAGVSYETIRRTLKKTNSSRG